MQINQEKWEEVFKGVYNGEAGFGVSMKEHTSLGIGGPADVLVSPSDPLSVKNIVLVAERENIPVLLLGGGSNILVRDSGIEGITMTLRAFRMLQVIREEEGEADLFVEAGLPLQALVNFSRENGYSGVEGLAGIPGTFGGAICGNAGSYGCQLGDVVRSVVILRPGGRLDRVAAAELGFGYRKSAVTPADIVLNATIRLRKDDKEAVSGRIKGWLEEKKKSQPLSARSAGCVFKNPGDVPAGKLIDEAGGKGMKVGGIEVSGLHANFFVNTGGGTAADYLALMQEVSSRVEKKYGVVLEPEIRVLGRG